MTTIEQYSTSNGGVMTSTSVKIYTQEEYEEMLEAGTWTGGFVEGIGYIMGELDVEGSLLVSDIEDSEDSWNDPFDHEDDFGWEDEDSNNSSNGGGNQTGGGSGTGNDSGQGHGNSGNQGDNGQALTTEQIVTLIDTARSYLGYNEDNAGDQIIAWLNVFGLGATSPTQYGWCAAFVYAMFQEAGLTGYKSARVDDWKNNWGEKVTSPLAGDVAFYPKVNHMGIVIAVEGNKVTVISGNYSNSVKLDKKSISYFSEFRRGK